MPFQVFEIAGISKTKMPANCIHRGICGFNTVQQESRSLRFTKTVHGGPAQTELGQNLPTEYSHPLQSPGVSRAATLA